MRNNRITSLVIQQESWGILAPNEDSSHELKINKQGVVIHNIYNGANDKPIREYKYEVNLNIINDFFDFIENTIMIDSWGNDYSVDVFDGYHWTIKIRHSDNSVKKIEGTVQPPPKEKKLEIFIKEMIPFEEEPWIF